MRVLVLVPMKPNLPDRLRQMQYALLERLPAANPEHVLDIVVDDRGPTNGDAGVQTLADRVARMAPIRQAMVAMHLQRGHDFVLWIDADIIAYPADLPTRLLRRGEGHVAAPLVLLEGHGRRFYDMAGFVLPDGRIAAERDPFFRDLRADRQGRYALESVGCVYLVPAAVYRAGATHEPDAIYTEHRSVCRYARGLGYQVYALGNERVVHAFLPNYGEDAHEGATI